MEIVARSASTDIKQIRPGSKRSRIALKILFPLVSLLLVAVVCEGVCRIVLPIKGRNPIVITDAHAGWAGRPNLKSVTKADELGQFTISADGQGFRLAYPRGQSPPTAAPVVLLVGDSFAQGVAVNDDQTFAWFLARQTPYYIVNLGVGGYGTDQELVQLEEFLKAKPDLEVRHIILFVCENDFFDVQRDYHPAIARSKPMFHVSGTELVRGNFQPTRSDWLMDFSRFFWYVNNAYSIAHSKRYPPVEPGIELVAACLREMQHLAVARGAQLHILIHHPLKGKPLFDIKGLKHFTEQTGAIDITQRILDCAGPVPVAYDNAHWNAAAHRCVATLIETDILKVAAPGP